MNREKYFQNPNSPFLLNVVQEGDGLELLRDLKDEVAQLVIFDPQYKDAEEVGVVHKKFKDKKRNLYYKLDFLKEQSSLDIKKFLLPIERILKPNGYFCLWIDKKTFLNRSWFEWLPSNLKIKEILIWVNKFPKMGHALIRNHAEYCLLGQKSPFRLMKPKNLKHLANIFSELVSFHNKKHLHEKPYKMTKSVIEQLTNEGDLVIDPCAGSFVSLRACQKLGRGFLGTDLTLRKLMMFNINKERSRKLLKLERRLV